MSIVGSGAVINDSFVATGAIVSENSHINAAFVTRDEILAIPA